MLRRQASWVASQYSACYFSLRIVIFGDIIIHITLCVVEEVTIVSYIIRELTHEDFEDSMALGKYAFRIELDDEKKDYYRNNFISDGMTRYGLFEDQQLCTQLMLYHFDFYVQGKVFKGNGVGFVSSWPEFRRKGYVAKLISHALKEMNDKGQVISLLHPFSVQFYRKFGYELFFQRVKNEMPVNELKLTESKGKIVRESNYAELKLMYDEYSKQFNGMVARGDYHWNNAVPRRKKGSVIIYKNESNQNRGYMIYDIAPQSQKMNILEFVALDKEAYESFWSFIGQHDSMIESVEWYTPLNDNQFSELNDPRIHREIEQYGMARIVNVKAFVEQYSFLPSANCQYYIHIEDKQADWNNRVFSLEIDSSGNARLSEAALDKIDQKTIIKMTINTLSGLLLGYYSGDYLIWNERIDGDHQIIKAFVKHIPQQETQLIDYF